MLAIPDLTKLCEDFKTECTEVIKNLELVSADDYKNFIKEVNTADDEAILISILPSVGMSFKNVDNFKFANDLHFFIVQRSDDREGYEKYYSRFKFTQPLIKKLFDFLYAKSQESGCSVFKYFDFGKLDISPVTNFNSTYGFSLSMPLLTEAD